MLTPIELRHDLHQHPELALEEFRTTRVLEENIEEIAEEYQAPLKIHRPLETGLVVEYSGQNFSDYILLRADIDALPLSETTGVEFQSQNDNMHACGHDVHTAILYGAIESIVRNNFNKNILFLFQPAEEAEGGAKKIIETNFLNNYNIKQAHALHVTDDYLKGTIATCPDIMFASSTEINITFNGEAAHIAQPENGSNALDALRKFISQSEKLSEQYSEKIIFGIGVVQAGDTRNIIPEEALLRGTLRAKKLTIAQAYLSDLKDILNEIRTQFGVNYNIQLGSQYHEVVNSQNLFEYYSKILPNYFEFINCEMKLTAEDFGYFSELYPTLMFWLGTGDKDQKHNHGLHSPNFLPDDDIIKTGINVYNEIIKDSTF